MKFGTLLGFLMSLAFSATALGDACSIAPMYEKARKECAAKNTTSCFVYTTLHDNKEQWPKMEEVCRKECKGNPASCQQYQEKGLILLDERCLVDPDACDTKETLKKGQTKS